MIDDLITKGTIEPYRMLTSRAEYRLLLRADNADSRLTAKAIKIGCISKKRQDFFIKKQSSLENDIKKLQELSIFPNKLLDYGINTKQNGVKKTAFELLSFQKIHFKELTNIWPELELISEENKEQIKIIASYDSYLKRQEKDIANFKKDENIKIPEDINFDEIKSLSSEVREKLKENKPRTIGLASRISGITPASIMAIIIYLKGKNI